jgi:hypothetical protein
MISFKKVLPLFVVAAVAFVGVLGASTYQWVHAQAATPTPSAPAAQGNSQSTAPANPGKGARGGMEGMRGGYTQQQLADALGIDLTKLQAAEKSAQAEALKQAVAAGQITQAQADQITARGGGFGDLGPFHVTGIDTNALLAKALNITTDQLAAAKIKAYNTAIDAAVTAGNMTQAQADLAKGRFALENNSKFQSSLTSAYQAAVKQALADGVITQAQADQLLANANGAGLGKGFGGGMMGGPMGGPGGHGGRGFGGNNQGGTTQPSNPTTPSKPSTTPSSSSSGI